MEPYVKVCDAENATDAWYRSGHRLCHELVPTTAIRNYANVTILGSVDLSAYGAAFHIPRNIRSHMNASCTRGRRCVGFLCADTAFSSTLLLHSVAPTTYARLTSNAYVPGNTQFQPNSAFEIEAPNTAGKRTCPWTWTGTRTCTTNVVCAKTMFWPSSCDDPHMCGMASMHACRRNVLRYECARHLNARHEQASRLGMRSYKIFDRVNAW